MCQVWSTRRIYVEGGLLINFLVSLFNCGRGGCCQRRNSLRWSSCKGRLIGVLLCYKLSDDRVRLKLLLNGWSCTVRLDGFITCMARYAPYSVVFWAGSFEDSYRCGSIAVGSVDACKTSVFTHFCQEILQLELPYRCITKPDLIGWIERACIVVFRFLPKAIASWIYFLSCAVWRISCKMGSVSSFWCHICACKFMPAYIYHVVCLCPLYRPRLFKEWITLSMV